MILPCATALLLLNIASTGQPTSPYGVNIWNKVEHNIWEQLSAIKKELEIIRLEQALLKKKQVDMDQILMFHDNATLLTAASAHLTGGPSEVSSPAQLWMNASDQVVEGDPCSHYTILDEAWRATNSSSKKFKCDQQVAWKGWYRLYYRGKSIQMPETCVEKNRCGTHAPLWLTQPHPKISDGVVTRGVCGHWKNKCCYFNSTPIQVKACRGNFYVYKFEKPKVCHLAYCADVNTLVCGRCRRNQDCVSRDKIKYRCAARRQKIKKQVIHFFASYPGKLRGKVNRIKFSKVLVNMGNAFNKFNGVFRAPVSGLYQFYFSSQTARNVLETNLWLVVDGYWVTTSHSVVKGTASIGSLCTYMTFLRKGSQVYVTHSLGQSWADSVSNTITFGGSLLVQMKFG